MTEKVYPLMGSLFGITCGRQNHEFYRGEGFTETPWCEECEKIHQENSYLSKDRPKRAPSPWEEDPNIQHMLAKRPEVGCWEHQKREHVRTAHYISPCYCEECPGQPGHKWTDHKDYRDKTKPDQLYNANKPYTQRRSCDNCPCPRYKWKYVDRTVYVPKPGHMIRCGIPWSKRYAPKGYTGAVSYTHLTLPTILRV